MSVESRFQLSQIHVHMNVVILTSVHTPTLFNHRNIHTCMCVHTSDLTTAKAGAYKSADTHYAHVCTDTNPLTCHLQHEYCCLHTETWRCQHSFAHRRVAMSSVVTRPQSRVQTHNSQGQAKENRNAVGQAISLCNSICLSFPYPLPSYLGSISLPVSS